MILMCGSDSTSAMLLADQQQRFTPNHYRFPKHL
jgi:hypothetical protein